MPNLGAMPQAQAPGEQGREATHRQQRTSRLPGRIHFLEPVLDRRAMRREASMQRIAVSGLRMLDGELETGQSNNVVRVAAIGELQGTSGQPLQDSPELTVSS